LSAIDADVRALARQLLDLVAHVDEIAFVL